ncbi:MAG: ATP-binding protein [Fulvivirga sp.]
MHKIRKLRLSDFKFFNGKHELDFERKNVLIYGENGSGKSSIYWALYTFLQSVFKTDDKELKKYFDVSDEQNLVNRFAKDGKNSSIEVEFEDDNESITTRKISFSKINTKDGDFVREATVTSDFIHYRLLASIYNFSNRDHIDLFSMFEDHILMFVTFTQEFKAGNANAADWWSYLKPGMQPRTVMHHPEYKEFQRLVDVFNHELENYLNKILETANEYLQEKFKEKLKINFKYIPTTYDAFLPNSTTKRDHITVPPKIIMTITFLHDKIQEEKNSIHRPHSFLNEARLTSIALSIRFAILDEKYIAEAPKILVLDDLLVSLDMSNRDIVLELILNSFKQYQIFIMTHDRSFFNLCKKRIEHEKCQKDWVVREMYQDEKGGIPVPFIPKNTDYLDKAEKYIREFDYPASANYLRKESERLLKKLLPKNKTLTTTEDEGTKPLPLDTLMDNFQKHYTDFGGDFTQFKKLKEYKDLILNPLSHDNIDTPIYKQELIALKEIMIKLRELEYRSLVLIEGDEPIFIYLLEMDSSGTEWIYKIQLLENLKAIKLLDGTWKVSNPKCSFLKRKNSNSGDIEELNISTTLYRGYKMIRHKLLISEQAEKDFKDIIKVPFNGSKLLIKDILNN